MIQLYKEKFKRMRKFEEASILEGFSNDGIFEFYPHEIKESEVSTWRSLEANIFEFFKCEEVLKKIYLQSKNCNWNHKL